MNAPIFDQKNFTEQELIDLRLQAFEFITRTECLNRTSPPKAVIVAGGPGVGKTRYIRANYSKGYIYLDAGELFRIYEQGMHLEFPGSLRSELTITGFELTQFVLIQRYNFVMEFIGSNKDRMRAVIDSITALGYQVEYEFVYQDIEKAWEWNLSRGRENISAVYCQAYHYVWITKAAEIVRNIRSISTTTL